jgi:hypothetical protein
MCPIIARETVEIPTERFSGPIVKVEITKSRNDEGKIVEYVNCTVDTGCKDIKGWNGLMKFSVPAYLSKNSALGRLLLRLGFEPTFDGKFIFDEQELEDVVVIFDTKRDGNFTNVVVDTVRRVEE